MPVHFVATVGRVILGAYFLLGGVSKIFGAAPMAAQQIAQMTAHGLPSAEYLFPLSGACEIIGGVTLLIGLHTRLVATLLAAFVILVSVTMHKFWGAGADLVNQKDYIPALAEAQAREQFIQMIMFMKNMTTFAGLLAFVGFGSGPLAVDNLYREREAE